MIFMAGGIENFMRRLGGFLGTDSYVFPPITSKNLRPKTRVHDVLYELYEFRNIIAHGLEIPGTPYGQKSDLISTEGERISYDDHRRGNLMLESSLFMLTTSLRKIFLENLFDEAKYPEKWRIRMKLYEHRYQEAGGPEAKKQRGR